MEKESDKEFEVRTDLALEMNEAVTEQDSRFRGVIVNEQVDDETGIKVTMLEIVNEHGEKLLGRQMGTYITIEAEELSEFDDLYNERAAEILADNIQELMYPYMRSNGSVLVIGLGNREVTADSLGPDVVERLLINRHILPAGDRNEHPEDGGVLRLSALSPGVMAQTGMETAEIIKGIVKEVKPDMVIAIDALAARNTKRLNTTIQLSDKGIHPGSGVGNHRVGITQENIGVPVLAIGVPTVIDAPTIVNDTMENFIKTLAQTKELQVMSQVLAEYTPQEQYQLIREIISPEMVDMYVTPKDVDANVRVIGATLAQAINQVVCQGNWAS